MRSKKSSFSDITYQIIVVSSDIKYKKLRVLRTLNFSGKLRKNLKMENGILHAMFVSKIYLEITISFFFWEDWGGWNHTFLGGKELWEKWVKLNESDSRKEVYTDRHTHSGTGGQRVHTKPVCNLPTGKPPDDWPSLWSAGIGTRSCDVPPPFAALALRY